MAGLALEVLTGPPCPRVGVLVTGLHASTASVITVWRSAPGEDRAPVRGMRKLTVTDAIYMTDYEAPLGRPVQYALEVHSGPIVPAVLAASITVESTSVWLQDPLDPFTACEVGMGVGGQVVTSVTGDGISLDTDGQPYVDAAGTLNVSHDTDGQPYVDAAGYLGIAQAEGYLYLTPIGTTVTTSAPAEIVLSSSALTQLGYPDPSSLVRVMGAKYPTMLGGGRMGAQSVPLDMISRTIEAANMLRILLGSASPLLLRTIPRISTPLPALCYLSASVVEEPVTAFIGGEMSRWKLTGDLVNAPSINLLVATWTYAQVSVLYATYADAAARGGSYLDWMRSPLP